MNSLRLGFLASHTGSNMQAIIDACKNGTLNAEACVVISNNSSSKALARAKKEGIPHFHLSGATHPDFATLDKAILDTFIKYDVGLVILAGYMKKIGPLTLEHFHGKIINIHPALLPKYGGLGMYGKNVHEAVLASGEKETGITIHLVDRNYDTGRIINQCKLPVYANDDTASLGNRVLEQEHIFFVETLQKISKGDIVI